MAMKEEINTQATARLQDFEKSLIELFQDLEHIFQSNHGEMALFIADYAKKKLGLNLSEK